MNTKFFLFSKTIIGLLMLGLTMLLQMWKVPIAPADQTALSSALYALVEGFATCLMIWGRVTADTPLHFWPKAWDAATTSATAKLLLLVGLLGALGGCQTGNRSATPLETYNTLQASYNAVVPVLLDLRVSGVINDDTWKAVKIYEGVAFQSLGQIKVKAEAGDTAGVDVLITAVQDALTQLIAIQTAQHKGVSYGPIDDIGIDTRWRLADFRHRIAGEGLSATGTGTHPRTPGADRGGSRPFADGGRLAA